MKTILILSVALLFTVNTKAQSTRMSADEFRFFSMQMSQTGTGSDEIPSQAAAIMITPQPSIQSTQSNIQVNHDGDVSQVVVQEEITAGVVQEELTAGKIGNDENHFSDFIQGISNKIVSIAEHLLGCR